MAGWRSNIVDSLWSYEAPTAAAGPTALDVTKVVSLLTAGTDDTQDTYTLAAAQAEQYKICQLVAGTDGVKITPAALANYTYVELTTIGDYVVFKYTGVEWEIVYLGQGAEAT